MLFVLYLASHVLIVLYVMAAGQPQALVSSVLVYADGAKYVLSGIAASLGITGTLLYLYLFFVRADREDYQIERKTKKRLPGCAGSWRAG